MPRPKRITTIRTTTNSDEEEEEKKDARREIETDAAEIQYAEFVSQYHGAAGCRVKVYRHTPRGRQYCFFGTPEEISEETIRLFHAKQPYASEEGIYYLSVEVNGELRNSFPVLVAPQVGTPGSDTPHIGNNGGMAEVIRLIQSQNERLEQRLMQQDRAPLGELVDSMYKLDQMRGAGGGQQPIDMMLKCIELGQKMNGTGAPEDGWSMLMGIVKDAAPALVPALMKAFQAKAPGETMPQVPPAIPPQQAVGENMPPSEQETMILRECVTYLKKKAMAGSNPMLYVDLIVDNAEDPLYERLISHIVDNDFSTFAKLDPDIEKPQYREFFVFIYDRIRSSFGAPNPMAADSSGKGGNKTNASVNGAHGKASSK